MYVLNLQTNHFGVGLHNIQSEVRIANEINLIKA